ncbi:MAG: Rrf2 family transcriptional regulator [Candidatus Zixiibacteriota bacterium]
MKFSTRARYGLRMMVELARLQQSENLVQLKRIAKITGLSNNYLGQLAISLKDDGLLLGVSGKNGGYKLSRAPEEITLRQIIRAVQGPILVTDCVANPDQCLNAEFCEARTIWVLVSEKIQELLEEFSLADLIDKNWMKRVREENQSSSFLIVENLMRQKDESEGPGCALQR